MKQKAKFPSNFRLRILSFMLLGIFCLTPLFTVSAAPKKMPEYVTAQELYAQTREGWQATYVPPKKAKAPKDYVITVNLPIVMPNVEKVPVIETQINHDTLKDDPYLYSWVQPGQAREDGGVQASSLPDSESFPFDLNAYPATEDGQAENNPMTPEDAAAVYYELARKYMKVDNFQLRAIGGFCADASEELYGTKLQEWHQKLNPAPYVMKGEQVFEGIPALLDGRNTSKRYFAPSHFEVEL